MLVARWYNNRDIRLEEVQTPAPKPDEMLVKVLACGICGSDVVEWYRLPRAPLVQGHEIGAEVTAVGEAVREYAVGDRVFIAPKVPCMKCDYCLEGHYPVCAEIKERLPGGFAEYILVPPPLIARGTYRLPDGLSFDQSTFIEPLACVVRAQRLAHLGENHTILVMGCGMSGLLQVKLAGSRGCRVIATDINPIKLERAAANGADMTCDATGDISRLADEKPDVVMLCTSATNAVNQAFQLVDKGGTVVFFSVPGPGEEVTVPINHFWTREMRIITSYYCGPPDIKDAIQLIEKGTVKVEDLITHVLPLEETAKGFQLVMDGADSIKVIVKPHP
jgi:L-iditol 2-dehydrogenase